MLGDAVSTLWDSDLNRFITIIVNQGADNGNHGSLMAFLPLILGEKLNEPAYAEIKGALLDGLLRDGYITQWGLATEAVSSPQFNTYGERGDNGKKKIYWRGAVWAPPVLMICDGLKRMGEEELAAQIARNFCELCKESGFAENFDPMLGLNQEDPAYTWTASTFLILASDYLE